MYNVLFCYWQNFTQMHWLLVNQAVAKDEDAGGFVFCIICGNVGGLFYNLGEFEFHQKATPD